MSQEQRQPVLLPAVVIALAVLITYAPAIRSGFIWDDDSYVTENETLRTTDGLRRIWFEVGAIPQYYPLVHTTFWIEYQLWQDDATGYHVVNVCLHALACGVLLLILRRLGVPGALLATAIFALHPVQVESVAWITERKNVLSGVFYVVALWAYLRFDPLSDTDEPEPRKWGWYVLSLACFFAALLSKTVTASFPAAILLLVYWKRRRLRVRDIAPTVPFFFLGIGLGLMTVWLERSHVGATGEEWSHGVVERLLIAGRALWFYAEKLVWPHPLVFIYPRWIIDAAAGWQYLYPAAALVAILALVVLRKRIGRGPLVAVLFFAGTLAPALGFLNVYPHRYSYVADHFQYLGCLGLIVLGSALLTLAARRLSVPPLARSVGAILLVGVLAILSWRQTHDYRDLETLWRRTIAKNPSAWMAYNNLGGLLSRRGELHEAESLLRKALRLKPDHVGALLHLSNTLDGAGRRDEAIDCARKALRIDRSHAPSECKLGTLLLMEGDLEEAKKHLARSVELNPLDPHAQNNLAGAYERLGDYRKAAEHYAHAVALNPDYAAGYNNLGLALHRLGELKEAISAYRRALELDPERLDVRVNLGMALKGLGRRQEAIEQFRQVLQVQPGNTRARAQLRAALETVPPAERESGPATGTVDDPPYHR